MRILHIFDHTLPLHSGYAFRSAAILAQQRALGWQTLQLSSSKQGTSPGTFQGTHHHALPADASLPEDCDGWQFYRTAQAQQWWARLPLLRHVAVITSLAQRLLPLARDWRPDVLHAHSPVLNAIAALHVGRKLGIPFVYEVRALWEDAAADHGSARQGGLRYRLTRTLESWALRRADAVTTICDGLRAELLARGVPDARLTVIPNAVDQVLVAAQPDVAAPPAAHPTIGFIGSYYAYEGLALLLQAMPRLLAVQPELRLLLAGGGPQEEALKTLAAQLGIAGQVAFLGRVPHEQVGLLYQRIDVLVYPRLPMRLTELVTPLKPLEAMAQGRLVLASDVGGHRELIAHGQTGMLFEAGSADALVSALLSLLAAPERWPALRTQARSWVLQQRLWTHSVARYAQVYGAVANKDCAGILARAPGVQP